MSTPTVTPMPALPPVGRSVRAYFAPVDRVHRAPTGGVLEVRADHEVTRPEAAGAVGHEEYQRSEGREGDDDQHAHFQL